MWVKQESSEINSIEFRKLIKNFGHEGLGIVMHVRFLFMNMKDNCIKYSDKDGIEDLALLLNFNNETLLKEIIDFCLKVGIFTFKTGCIHDPVVSKAGIATSEEKSDKAKKAADIRWENYRKQKEDFKKIEVSDETFDKSLIDDYEGSFPVSDISLEPETIENKSNYPEIFLLFQEYCTEYFSLIPDVFRLPNKYEKQALEQIKNMINDGIFSKSNDIDNYLVTKFANISKNTKPSFYLTEFSNSIHQDLTKLKVSDGDMCEQWIINALNKYQYIGAAKR
jgi:hypothetical protein